MLHVCVPELWLECPNFVGEHDLFPLLGLIAPVTLHPFTSGGGKVSQDPGETEYRPPGLADKWGGHCLGIWAQHPGHDSGTAFQASQT